MKTKLLLYLSCALFVVSCTNEKAARKRLALAEEIFQTGELNSAKLHIDSIKILYPKEFGVQREGLTLMRKIELIEQQRNIHYCDSMLQVRLAEVEPLKKPLVLQKDTAYEEIGTWVSRFQTVERNIKRSYIRSGVNEMGEMYIASVFYGKGALNHTGIRVSVGDETVETEIIPYDGGSNYRFTDLGMTSEIVTYKRPKDNGVIDLICRNADKRIKVQYTGGKPYTLYMDDQAKKAIKDIYELAIVLTDIERLKKEILVSTARIEYLNSKLTSKESIEE
ncbi:hypothetical protein MASR1M31_16180 [Porphyromonadaceae bacterium]